MFGSSTLENHGKRNIGLRTTRNSNHCAVLLGVTMSGENLPPFIVFTAPGTRDGHIAFTSKQATTFPVGIKYAFEPKA